MSSGMADRLDAIDDSLQRISSPPLVPDSHVIDLSHLFRMTLGDQSLQREVLQLFERQADMLIARMNCADPAGVAALAHTLKGSARGIGAWGVAAAAEGVETACAASAELESAVATLADEARRARLVIADHLSAT